MAVLLALVTIALYWPATRHDFVNYDDNLYVTENSHVQAGLTWEGVKWAFLQSGGRQLASVDDVVAHVGLPAVRIESLGPSPDQRVAACRQHGTGFLLLRH